MATTIPHITSSSPPQLPPFASANIPVEGNVSEEMQVAKSEGVASLDMCNPNSTHGDSEDYFVPSMRGKAPSIEASKPTRHEVGLVSSKFKS
jgi:hypothetical protein